MTRRRAALLKVKITIIELTFVLTVVSRVTSLASTIAHVADSTILAWVLAGDGVD